MAFIRHFLIYGLAGAASRLAAILLVPLYTHALSVADYGTLELMLAVHALVVLMGGLQVESAVARDYKQVLAGIEPQAYRWTALWLILAGTTSVGLTLALVWIVGALPADLQGSSIGILISLTAPAQLLSVQLIMLRFSGRATAFALLSFSDLSLSALFSWLFIVVLDEGLNGALIGLLCGKLLCMTLAWPLTFGWPRLPVWRPTVAREMMAYGVPSLPAVFINWLQNNGNRVLLASALTVQDVALAGLAVKVSMLYGFVVYSFRLAWEPYAMGRLSEPQGSAQGFDRALEWYVATMFILCGLSVAMGPAMVDLLSPAAYSAAEPLAAYFVVGQFWVGVTNVMVIGIHGSRKTSYLLPVSAFGVVINVTILVALAPWLGVAAAGLGFLVGAVTSALVAAYYSNRLFNTGFSWRLVGAAVAGSLVLLWALQAALPHDLIASRHLSSAAIDLAIGALITVPTAVAVLWLGCGLERTRDLLASVPAMSKRRIQSP